MPFDRAALSRTDGVSATATELNGIDIKFGNK
jgi:hypothetical protein